MSTLVARREMFIDPRGSALQTTWHEEHGMVVVSVWHGRVCVGTVRLDPGDATRLAQFLVGHLGEMATAQSASTSSSVA
jgi:hypothetical protein